VYHVIPFYINSLEIAVHGFTFATTKLTFDS
jgi:hypothetical protein